MKSPHDEFGQETVVLRVVARALVPFILLFALYVQFHGDFGPGGGFQAGVIFAAGLILHALIHGLDALQAVVTKRRAEVATALGVLLYAGVGLGAFVSDGGFLDYGALDRQDPVHGQHVGILLVEVGVGITVAAVMTLIFYAFAERVEP